ncbi:MAG TPA: tol-pal system-associated acyl-CoA thioesterase [Microvirga sp.]|nr:tol-pal system-associated acyl-CoA thioesterase [Microvirga sp.]
MINHLTVRVYFEDTDFSGFAYHGSYVRFLERGRTELVRAMGISQAELHEHEGFAFVVRRMALEYLKPARMDDELVVATRLAEMRGASMILTQEIARAGEILLTAQVTVAATRRGRATRIPDAVRAAAGGRSG